MLKKARYIAGIFCILLFTNFVYAQKLSPLRISEDRRYLVTATDKPFFWLGDTAWELIHRLDREEIIIYLNDRAAKGFTVIQTVVLAELDGLKVPNAYGDLPLINEDPSLINERYFRHVDFVIKEASKRGLYIGLLPTWGDKFNIKWGRGPEIFTPDNAEIYGNILASRYKNQDNIIWILGGDRAPETEEHFQIIKAMTRGIKKAGGNQLLTYHPVGGRKATGFFNEPWLDIDMFQSGHDRDAKVYDYVTKSRKVEPVRPVINGEPGYENSPNKFWEEGEHGWLDDGDVRNTAYWTMLSGAAGYTYGAHDIWQMYSMDKISVTNARTGWKEALHLPGSRQMMFMKQLFQSFPWQDMVPDQSIILNDNPEGGTYSVSARGREKDFIIAYTPQGKPLKMDLTKINAERVNVFWYNPRSGKYKEAGEFNTSAPHEFQPWAKGRGSDFILIIIDTKADYFIPVLDN